MSPHEASVALASPTPPLLLDGRGREAYGTGTLPGAINAGREPAGFLPDGRGGPVILVLPRSSPAEFEAAWAKRLRDFGYSVSILAGGIEAWQAAGLPTELPASDLARPGSIPFTIPRGLCETNPPAQVFE